MLVPEPVFFLSHFRIKEGQLDFVRQFTSDAAARLEAEKPRTVLFLSYLDADGGTVSFLHAFADAESMDVHFVGADERRPHTSTSSLWGGRCTGVQVRRPWRLSDRRPTPSACPWYHIPSTWPASFASPDLTGAVAPGP
jgi:hypothetical protein